MKHIPVLLQEMLLYLAPKDGGLYVDATFGAGGYSQAILQLANCQIYAIDRDAIVKNFYIEMRSKYSNKIQLSIDKFSNMKKILETYSIERVDGIVFDVGTSSMQLSDGNRGFSFLHNGPLNMNMDNTSHMTASTFIHELNEKEMADIIFSYGGEKHARKIARAIVNVRQKKMIKTTHELANIIHSVISRGKHRIDSATKTFQAIRIWVNDELKELKKGITVASSILNKNGILIVITFHSLEDRIVKTLFKDLENTKIAMNQDKQFHIVNKKIIRASIEEVTKNPRARSAKLRVIQRLL
ncbi:16S rRNA (cytosine(1402)-N(4))-methyltransferase RsmH [Wolbachia endosymbiont of Howardula sp.]|uniref:16S rRNA (cytosine(1402)-N(4))-methyltransferase RsmH n=1 Tax=Wolbachia endosymbiont of Howardula sp. TaxID=2916816 RepID=UPI00217CDF44|nr:16S rRNA (cytosine(1402)-N(4))-methyltransferase RsmH [Wolbachia endosymbiont of Howardula sp.]UWI82989.1 16S rRNA (cytosine(1402)-N(4))-methyltransferase RsmH [Wolbachia endosymbiont of Howardula sp.]